MIAVGETSCVAVDAPVDALGGEAPSEGVRRDITILLAKIIRGRAAAQIDVASAPSGASIGLLPLWVWDEVQDAALLTKLRKSLSSSVTPGAPVFLPRRLDFDGGVVQVIEGARERVPATVCSGEADRTILVDFTPVQGDPGQVVAELIQDGKMAEWGLRRLIEPTARVKVERSVKKISAEVRDCGGQDWLLMSPASMEGIVDVFMLGDADRTLTEAPPTGFERLLTKLLRPRCFDASDPWRFVVNELHRECEQVVQLHLEDPRIGPRVRKVAREMPGATLAQITEEFNARYPYDRAGENRVRAALNLSSDPLVGFMEMDGREMQDQTGRYRTVG